MVDFRSILAGNCEGCDQRREQIKQWLNSQKESLLRTVQGPVIKRPLTRDPRAAKPLSPSKHENERK
jgi:predicted Fe-S protein YdhL (DUF1289 family)